MSQAVKAKSAKSRATIALRLMRTVKSLGSCRAFDDCFEMGDGDDVVTEIIQRSQQDPSIAELVERRGYGYWLKPGYMERFGVQGGVQ